MRTGGLRRWLLTLIVVATPADASWLTAPCEGCQIAGGFGLTPWGFHVAGQVVPVSFTWLDNRYEFAGFYFSKQVRGPEFRNRILAPQDWAVSLSRRWRVWRHGPWDGWLGAGLFYRTGDPCPNPAETPPQTYALRPCNRLNGSNWNFGLQVGTRWWEADRSSAIELALRHFSNGELKPPNEGQNVLTLEYVF